MAFALQFDGVNDHVTVDFPIPFFNGSTYDATYEWEVASVSGGDVWLAGAGSTNNAIELRPSINTFRVRYNSTEFTFDISGLGLTYNDLNVYRLRGWFDGTTRRMSLHVNDTLVEQKDGVSDARPTTTFDYLGRVGSSSYQTGLLSYASLSDVNDSTNDRFYDARSTSSGSSLPETTANAGDGTLVNFPGDDSQWVDQGGGGLTITLPTIDSTNSFDISGLIVPPVVGLSPVDSTNLFDITEVIGGKTIGLTAIDSTNTFNVSQVAVSPLIELTSIDSANDVPQPAIGFASYVVLLSPIPSSVSIPRPVIIGGESGVVYGFVPGFIPGFTPGFEPKFDRHPATDYSGKAFSQRAS